MYKLLIADDDPNIRMGIRAMIEREFQGELTIYTSENGYEASEQIKKMGIHMLVTDIKMPIWTGLELISHLKEEGRSIPTVVLSGYDDYNLVRSALTEGAVDYLLKPVNEGLLLNTIRQMMRNLKVQTEITEGQLDESWERQLLLEQFMDSSLWEEERILKYREKQEITEDTLCMLVYGEIPSTAYVEKQKLGKYMAKKTSTFLKEIGMEERALYGELGECFQLLVFLHKDHKKKTEEIQAYAKELGKEGYKVSWGSKPYALKNLSFLKVECSKGMERFYFDLPYNKLELEHPAKELEKELSEYTEAMGQYDCGAAIRHLTQAFQIYNSYPPKISHLQKELTNTVYAVMQKNAVYIGIIGQSKFTEHDMLEQIAASRSLAALQSQMIDTVNHYIEKAVEGLNNRDDFVIRKAKVYVQDNFAEQVTLTDVAAHVYLNASYFSTLFKAKTGMNFRNYLRECRVEKAKELLQQGELKIYEIAQQVGYQESAHFVRAFKEVTGMSPNEYRK